MKFSDSIKTCLTKKPFTFKGRACRSEFWWFALFFYISCFVFGFSLDFFEHKVSHNNLGLKLLTILYIIILLYMVIAYFAATVRRLHDSSHSGWNILLRFIPYIGPFIVLYMLCKKSDESENEYGPNPLNNGVYLSQDQPNEKDLAISITPELSKDHEMPKDSEKNQQISTSLITHSIEKPNKYNPKTEQTNQYNPVPEINGTRMPIMEHRTNCVGKVKWIIFLCLIIGLICVIAICFSQCSKTKGTDNWPTYEFNSAFTIKVPETMELRSQYDKYTRITKKNLEILKYDVDMNDDAIVFQQKGLSSMNDDSFDTYSRVLISYFQLDLNQLVEHNWESHIMDDEMIEIVNYIFENDINGCVISKEPTYNCISINDSGSKAITITYEREGNDGPVSCHGYILCNYDEMIKMMVSYRIKDSSIWKSDCEQIINTFNWVNPK